MPTRLLPPLNPPHTLKSRLLYKDVYDNFKMKQHEKILIVYLIPFYVFISSTQEALGLGVQAENSARFSLLLTLLHHSFTSQSNT